ncbi:MAG: DUF364 domain-containing protein [Desulfobacterota bacterium]|nr:DUF364 domain-containing protein [Thermodesulfobacteriota bacterium]
MLERLYHYTRKRSEATCIADVRIGLCYTAVMLDDGCVGLAYTFREAVQRCCATRKHSQPFTGRSIVEMLRGITSGDMLERTVGIAAANAVLNRESDRLVDGDALDLIELRHDDVVGMVGYFGPLVEALRKRVRRLLIFEQKSIASEEVYPEEKAPALLQNCTVALITATTIINNTFEQLINAATSCRVRVVLGPSTPLAPEVFAPLGVSLLSGVIVADPAAVLRIVSEGGGMQAFKNCVKKVNLKL